MMTVGHTVLYPGIFMKRRIETQEKGVGKKEKKKRAPVVK